ncbi:MAG: GAF domain-containing protein [Candidatus Baltobacteraceae bacterium]
MPGLAIFAHDVDLSGIAQALGMAGMRVCTHPQPGAIHLVAYGESVGVIASPQELPAMYLNKPLDPKAVLAAVRTAAELIEARRAVKESKELLTIATALAIERDRTALYRLIVRKLRELTLADSGTLFTIEGERGREVLRFAIRQTGPQDAETFAGGSLAVSDASLAGHVARSGKPLRFADVYKDAGAYGLIFDKSFDEESGYRTKSMLCVPLMSRSGDPAAVLQLVNKKLAFDMPLLSAPIIESGVEPFDDRDEELICALAVHAGAALHNVDLMEALLRAKA